MTEVELIEQAALRVGMKSLMNHGAASCVYSEGCEGVTQEHLIAFAREIALHCAVALAAPGAPGQEALQNSGPRRIYLDIGDPFALEGILAGTTDWQVEGVTWSEDNATSHGVEYVRADLAAPALSGEPAGWMFQNDVTGNVGFVDAQQVEWGFWKNNPRLHEICPLYRAAPTAPATQTDAAEAGQEAAAGPVIAYATVNEEGDPAMLFFDKQEAMGYCEDDDEPIPLADARGVQAVGAAEQMLKALKFHRSASHVSPDFRDDFNATLQQHFDNYVRYEAGAGEKTS